MLRTPGILLTLVLTLVGCSGNDEAPRGRWASKKTCDRLKEQMFAAKRAYIPGDAESTKALTRSIETYIEYCPPEGTK